MEDEFDSFLDSILSQWRGVSEQGKGLDEYTL